MQKSSPQVMQRSMHSHGIAATRGGAGLALHRGAESLNLA